ncbi:hypothetical protein ADN00_06415 [Ornatilinea apprima]|uniref:S-adenosyl-L-methionine-dependent methyltransferase n=1 Tax=Ornatilinea apprima TaxID=1134406 RepID=A0A0P6XQ32_9CHLR|nr:SAM-dependent methyltransferase [Ornatilinea apprima]KPL78845.1 hypothetical protein ADN00_06415 [Ornatilinea apprima]
MVGNGLEKNEVIDAELIEKNQRLSHSILWRLHSAFYQQSGVTAWNRGHVPHYITNNPTIAAAYAHLVLDYLQNLTIHSPQQPVFILELGGGSGRFAFYFLNYFLPETRHLFPQGTRFVYLLTDLAESNLNFWKTHPALQPFLRSGELELACFNPLTDHQISLTSSGTTLTRQDIANPLIVLGNYFFDSLPNDVFSIHGGILCEELVSLKTRKPLLDPVGPSILPSLEISFRPRFISAPYYHNQKYNRLLRQYLAAFSDSYVLMPIGALECLRNLLWLSRGKMYFLSADKGDFQLNALQGLNQPEISLHGSAISMKVNYHALAAFTRQSGGQAFQSKHRDEGLVFSTFLFGASANLLQSARRAFNMTFETASPDDFFVWKKALQPYYSQLPLEQLLAILRLSGYDPQIFGETFHLLLEYAQTADPRQKDWIAEAARRVFLLYYPIGEALNLYLPLARLFLSLSRQPEAQACQRASREFFGPSTEMDTLLAQTTA